MTLTEWVRNWLKKLLSSLELPAPEVAHRLARIRSVERNLVLPLKAFAIGIILYSLYQSPWFGLPLGSLDITVTTLNTIFAFYVASNLLVAAILLLLDHLPFSLVRWSVFAASLIDAIFVGALTLVSGGYDSLLFWLFVVLIVRNVVTNPPVWSQLALNVLTAACFAIASTFAVGLNTQIAYELYGRPVPGVRSAPRVTNSVAVESPDAFPALRPNAAPPRIPTQPEEIEGLIAAQIEAEDAPEAILLRVIVLLLTGGWLFGIQVLIEKQKLAEEEAREFATRETQLRSAGRLAAEFAHQIKNPLAIVNTAVFSLERNLKTGKGDPRRHLRIIQEEISRADRIITEVMGYAELSEGRVEKLNLEKKIHKAVSEVFPEGLTPKIQVELDLHGPFPPLLMQRRHISEILLNLLQNARDALHGEGRVVVSARLRPDQSTEIIVSDNGPGIPPDKLDKIFEAYFTTKERGTGLGLAIVKNNVELYGGTIRVESKLGNGARFTLLFPARASVKLRP